MKQRLYVCLVISMIGLLLSGCGSKTGSQAPDIEGLLYSIHEKSILVIEEIESVDISQEEWQGKPAYTVHINDKTKIYDSSGKEMTIADLQIGDAVKVWITGEIMESYPAQVRAVKIQAGK